MTDDLSDGALRHLAVAIELGNHRLELGVLGFLGKHELVIAPVTFEDVDYFVIGWYSVLPSEVSLGSPSSVHIYIGIMHTEVRVLAIVYIPGGKYCFCLSIC